MQAPARSYLAFCLALVGAVSACGLATSGAPRGAAAQSTAQPATVAATQVAYFGDVYADVQRALMLRDAEQASAPSF